MIQISGADAIHESDPPVSGGEIGSLSPEPPTAAPSSVRSIDDDPLPPDDDETTAIVQPRAVARAMAAARQAAAKPQEPAADGWFVGINGVPVGPIRLSELRSKAATGAINLESLTWRETCDEWRPLRTFPELASIVEQVQEEALRAAERIAQARIEQQAALAERTLEAAAKSSVIAAPPPAPPAVVARSPAAPAVAPVPASPAAPTGDRESALPESRPLRPSAAGAPPRPRAASAAPSTAQKAAEAARARAAANTLPPEVAPPSVRSPAGVTSPVAAAPAPVRAGSPAAPAVTAAAPAPPPPKPASSPIAAAPPPKPASSPIAAAPPPKPASSPIAAAPPPKPASSPNAAPVPAAALLPNPAPVAATITAADLMPAVTPSAAPAPVAPSNPFSGLVSLPTASSPMSIPDPFGNGTTPGTLAGATTPSRVQGEPLDLVELEARAARKPHIAVRGALWLGLLVVGLGIGFVLFSPAQSSKSEAAPAPSAVVAAQPSEPLPSIPPPPAETASAASADQDAPTKPRAPGTRSSKAEPEVASKLTGDLKNLGSGVAPTEGPSREKPGETSSAAPAQELGANQIQSTVARYTAGVKRGCWQPALETRDRDAPSSARVNVTITVGPSGSVQDVSASGDPRGYPGLSSCITSKVRSWQFPAGSSSTTVNVPFVFAAQ